MADPTPERDVHVESHRVPSPPDRTVTIYDEYEHGPHDFGRVSAAIKRVSWGAIFAGAVVAIVTQFLLNLLGLGIGMTTFDPAGGDSDSAAGFGMAQGIWTVVSSLIALFVGGWVAGRLAGMPRRTDGMLHGVVTWALTTLLALYLLTTGVGRVVSGVTSTLGSGLGLVTQGVTAVAPQVADAFDLEEVDLSGIQREARELLQDVAATPGDARADVDEAIDDAFGGAGPVDGDRRDELVETLANRTDMTEAEARRTVNQWERRVNDARMQIQRTAQDVREDAPEVVGTVTDRLGTAAIVSFFALLLGLVAAALGGAVGSPHDLPVGAAGRSGVAGHRV